MNIFKRLKGVIQLESVVFSFETQLWFGFLAMHNSFTETQGTVLLYWFSQKPII